MKQKISRKLLVESCLLDWSWKLFILLGIENKKCRYKESYTAIVQ